MLKPCSTVSQAFSIARSTGSALRQAAGSAASLAGKTGSAAQRTGRVTLEVGKTAGALGALTVDSAKNFRAAVRDHNRYVSEFGNRLDE